MLACLLFEQISPELGIQFSTALEMIQVEMNGDLGMKYLKDIWEICKYLEIISIN